MAGEPEPEPEPGPAGATTDADPAAGERADTESPVTQQLPAQLDPGVELLADVPISGLEEDLFARLPVAQRVVELACAAPVTAPRVVALTGAPGAGKSSVLRIVTELLGDRADAATVAIDGAGYPSAQAVATVLVNELTRFFSAAGVVDASDKLRDTLASYGGVVASIARFAGVKVDVEGALKRSPDALRAELLEMTQEVGKRIVIVLDHVDRLPPVELAAVIAALRFYAAIPYVAIVIAVDRRATTLRLARTAGVDPSAMERLVQVELATPPADRELLARVLAGGLDRLASRLGRSLDAAFALFDPEGPARADQPAGLGLALVATPRDAKRAINAISAALPLVPTSADPVEATLEIMLRVLVPEVDTPRLDERRRLDDAGRAALYAELAGRLGGHRRVTAARAALAALIRPPG